MRFDQVWFRYAHRAAWTLRAVDTIVEPGATVVVLGRNGAGPARDGRAVARAVRNGVTVLVTGAVLAIVLGLSGSVAPWLAPPVMDTARALTADDLPPAGRFWLLAGWAVRWCAGVLGGYGWLRRSR